MDYNQVFAVSAAGMTAERTRVDVTALNLANAHTVAGADGKAFQPMRAVARPMQAITGSFDTLVSQGLGSVPEVTIEPTTAAPRMAYEPGHPLANDKGFVAYPGVDPATEMVTMMSAMRSYEANVAAMNTAKTMAMKALEIGGGS